MTNEQIKGTLQNAIQAFANGNLTKNSLELFTKLGYVTERRAPLDKPTFEEFKDTYILDIHDRKFDENKALVPDWLYVDLLFQLSPKELTQKEISFDTRQVDHTIIEAYLFFAIELKKEEYTRTELSNITREINHLFSMPVMVLFKYGKKLTFSVINRRLHKRDESKDVLEKVTLIKDISIESPLRAHIEILFDLSFQELLNKHQFTNFVELHNAWQKTLDTKELNKRFYSELFNWYLWAVQSVRFPNDVNDDKDDSVYNAESVIRLLTRLIFVWFIKEKNLIPETLFNVKKLKTILKNIQTESMESSVYYRAILQNLFFATLNTPMDKDITAENKDEKRRFINTLPKTGNDQYLDQTKYRYQDYFINPDKALELFATIPFLNGGLFECLDFKEGNKEIRFDGFSSTEKRQAFVPDKLFFANEFVLDLNAEYGTKGKKYKVKGLINILDSYKFTIAENTPLEEEIALDPELLGKVFENLLASYNPETQTTARKQTGSFYTPREIVNYMVDESLIAYFKQKLDNSEEVETRLRDLFAHTTDLPEFTEAENTALIKAISEAKVLDPACGSGAFPMGVLHRLVDLLNKLDPDNKKWNELQIQRAIDETAEVYKLEKDSEERKIRLDEINKAFDLSMNHPDYARKLFLIENCIYGVDIQSIAIQISKLRFFISLIADQKVNDSKPNRNILSMPNLETKFVAANTLIGLDKPQQMTLMAGDVERLEKELASIRHKIFFTRKYSAKKALKKKEKEKREELKQALIASGFGEITATQKAGWNPFDPMQSAKFFDPETMFGIVPPTSLSEGGSIVPPTSLSEGGSIVPPTSLSEGGKQGGFDIVIGNPPYVNVENLESTIKKYLFENYQTCKGRTDIYIAFIETALKLIKQNGVFSYIIPYPFTNQNYGSLSRKMLIEDYFVREILDTSEYYVFETAVVKNIILSVVKCKNKETTSIKIAKSETDFSDNSFIVYNLNQNSFLELKDYRFETKDISQALKFKTKIWRNSIRLDSICLIAYGARLNHKTENIGKENYIHQDFKKGYKPFTEGKNIDRYSYSQFGWLNYKPEEHYNPMFPELFENDKLIFINVVKDRLRFAYDKSKYYNSHTVINCVKWDLLKNAGHITVRRNLTKEKLINSSNFNYLFLLGLLNSNIINWYFLNFLSESLHFYPDDAKELPIPNINSKKQQPFITLVDQILTAKKANPKADTSELEKQIDELVYKLYELTEEEIKIIEGNE